MRVLLDECLPRPLGRALVDHDVSTVPEGGWAGKKNGELLDLAEGVFDVLITVDKGFSATPTAGGRAIAIVTLSSISNRLADLEPLVPRLLDTIGSISPGQSVKIAR